MANNPTSSILLKRSGVAGSVPTTTSLQVGEIALIPMMVKRFYTNQVQLMR